MCKSGKCHTKRVHQIVANSFLDKPSDFESCNYEVNHKDCNRKNNNIKNLEWITHRDNVRYSIECGNHFCTRDLTGSNNPNYKNNTLKIKYKKNPQLAKELLSRPHEHNGRAVRIALYDCNKNHIKDFNWMGGCANYFIENDITKAKQQSICSNIRLAIKSGKKYLNHYFKKIA